MVSTQSFIAPLIELARDESVQSKVLDVARQFFSNSNITINLIPALIAGGLLLLLLPLLFLFLAPADEAGTGYGAPAAEYGAPSSSYGAPSSSYGYRADEGYEEAGSYRSLLTDLLDSNAASSKPELARRMEELALPVVSKLAAAATKLIQ
jgi:hypothetical protein